MMTNHYHLVVETPNGNLAKGMRQLKGSTARRLIVDMGAAVIYSRDATRPFWSMQTLSCWNWLNTSF